MGEVTVLRPGPLTTVQDLGRQWHRALGVSRGGAIDFFAAQIANLLVANPEGAALLEITLGGVRLGFADERTLAWCGGEFQVEIAATPIAAGRPAIVRPGEEINISGSAKGARAWVAISGGVEVPKVLDSRSTDLRGGFGGYAGRALQEGDEISLGKTDPSFVEAGRVATWGAPAEWSRTSARHPVLRVVRGTEWSLFSRDTRAVFLQTPYAVSPEADRMGVRLTGTDLARREKRELLSEAVAPGTVQVAHDGQPIILLGDCQTIGGYPKIAHVITVDLPLVAQLQPNELVRFEEVRPAEAAAAFIAREKDLQLFRVGLCLRAS